MSKTRQRKHTRGPWFPSKGIYGNQIYANSGRKKHGLDDGLRAVASFLVCCKSDFADDEEANEKANGRLILMSTNMLEVLERISETGDINDVFERIENILDYVEKGGQTDAVQS